MSNKIYVWDPLLRLFHWLLVAAFTLAYFTGDEETSLHVYAGYTILGLLVFRLIWGLIGGRYARFSSFSLAPSAVVAYLGSLFSKKPSKDYVGHNPAGSWMVIALLLSLTLTGISGLKAYGEEGHGPLAQQAEPSTVTLINAAQADEANEYETSEHEKAEHEAGESEHHAGMTDVASAEHEGDEDEGEEFWEEIHEFFANLTVILVLLHIAGVVLSSRKHGENLVRAMITGYKEK